MNKILLSLVLFLLTACSYIGEEERLIYVKPESAKRVVLLEDFTGQKCTNCPKATDVIEQLQETYGEALVAVGIHGGPLAFAGNSKIIGLETETGNEYYNHWNLEYQPIGLVNRHGAVDYPEWAAAVEWELAKPAPLRLKGTAVLTEDAIAIQITAKGIEGAIQGKLQVWLLEDGIKAVQIMPDGTANQEYIHNHVFRTTVNGTWGENFSIEEGETITIKVTANPKFSDQLNIIIYEINYICDIMLMEDIL